LFRTYIFIVGLNYSCADEAQTPKMKVELVCAELFFAFSLLPHHVVLAMNEYQLQEFLGNAVESHAAPAETLLMNGSDAAHLVDPAELDDASDTDQQLTGANAK
jgi:hypothetical protein